MGYDNYRVTHHSLQHIVVNVQCRIFENIVRFVYKTVVT